jgi:Domain of unknown function (DUF4430)
LTRFRLHRLAAAVALFGVLCAAPAAASAHAIHVHVRVEGPARTYVQSDPVPLTGTFDGVNLPKPTALGALLAAARQRHVAVGLTNYACCGLFVSSIAGLAGDATHYWAFKVGHTLSALGAGSVPATAGMSVLFYYTTFDATTGATEQTLGLTGTAHTIAPGGSVSFAVTRWDDAGHHHAAGRAWLDVAGIATRVDSTGHAVVRFARTGTYPVRATRAGTIRSRTIWVHVVASASS